MPTAPRLRPYRGPGVDGNLSLLIRLDNPLQRKSSQMLSLLLLSLAIGAHSYLHLESHSFDLKGTEGREFEYDRNELYALIGPDNRLCLNITTSYRVKTLFGACGKNVAMEKMSTGNWVLAREEVNDAITVTRLSPKCKSKGLTLTVQGLVKDTTKVDFNWFRCYQEVSKMVPNGSDKPMLIRVRAMEIKPVPETWTDVLLDIPFNLYDMESTSNTIDMRRTFDALDVDPDRTMCFGTIGTMRNIFLDIQVCKNSKIFTIKLENATIVSLPPAIKAEILKSRSECPDIVKNKEWYLNIRANDYDPINGNLAVYSCRFDLEEDEGKDDRVYSAATQYQGLEKTFYYNVSANSHATYSADLKMLVDAVRIGKGLRSFTMDLNTTSNITLVMSRCSDPQIGKRKVLFKNHGEGTMQLLLKDLYDVEEMSKSAKCSPLEDDDALYITIFPTGGDATGIITFYSELPLPYTNGTNQTMPEVHVKARYPNFANFYYQMPFDMDRYHMMVRQIPLAFLFDDSRILGPLNVAFTLNSTGNVSIAVSRCRFSPRQYIAYDVIYGLYELTQQLQIAVQNVMDEPQCHQSEGMNVGDLYLHIETHSEPVHGIVQLGALKSEKNPDLAAMRSFYHSKPLTAVNRWDVINVTVDNAAKTPAVEFDIRYFIELVNAEPLYDLHMKVANKSSVDVVFSRWSDSIKGGVRIPLSELTLRTFSREEIAALRELAGSRKGDNTARYGIFVHIDDKKFKGVVSFWVKNFIAENDVRPYHYIVHENWGFVVGKEYNGRNDLLFGFSNTQNKPVDFYATFCKGEWKVHHLGSQFSKLQKMVLDKDVIQAVREDSEAACPSKKGLDNILYVTIVSEFAEGRTYIVDANSENKPIEGRYTQKIVTLLDERID